MSQQVDVLIFEETRGQEAKLVLQLDARKLSVAVALTKDAQATLATTEAALVLWPSGARATREAVDGIAGAVAARRARDADTTSPLLDPLTGLHGRDAFMAIADHQIKIARRAGYGMLLLICRLNELGSIRAERGQATVEKAEREVAGLLLAAFRESDVIARLRSGEYLVLALDAPVGVAEHLLGRFNATVGAFNQAERLPFPLNTTVGSVVWQQKVDVAADRLIKRAYDLFGSPKG